MTEEHECDGCGRSYPLDELNGETGQLLCDECTDEFFDGPSNDDDDGTDD